MHAAWAFGTPRTILNFARRRGLRASFLTGALAAACGLGASERDASAQAIPSSNGSGLDTHLFRPAVDSKGFFHTNGSDILGENDISFGLVID